MDITKFTSDSKDLLDRMYKETKTEVLGYKDYLKLEPTEGYKNNKERLERLKREAIQWGLQQRKEDELNGVEECKEQYVSQK